MRHLRFCCGDSGQALPVLVLVLWLCAGVTYLVLVLGDRARDVSRAQVGADAAALGEALQPGLAEELAVRNGASVVAITRGTRVEVVTVVGNTEASAAAVGTRPEWAGLDPRLQSALRAAERLMGEPVVVVSGLRSRQDQQRLWDARASNPYPVARPGTSLHELGLAVDVSLRQVALLAEIGPSVGVCQPLPLIDPVHFTLCQTMPSR